MNPGGGTPGPPIGGGPIPKEGPECNPSDLGPPPGGPCPCICWVGPTKQPEATDCRTFNTQAIRKCKALKQTLLHLINTKADKDYKD